MLDELLASLGPDVAVGSGESAERCRVGFVPSNFDNLLEEAV